jgi:hypothetical protein
MRRWTVGKKRRVNQKSIYLDDDILAELDTFMRSYPLLPMSMIVNAAMRFYFEAVESAGGVDGNLRPTFPLKRANAR